MTLTNIFSVAWLSLVDNIVTVNMSSQQVQIKKAILRKSFQ